MPGGLGEQQQLLLLSLSFPRPVEVVLCLHTINAFRQENSFETHSVMLGRARLDPDRYY
jgi:hypothetical protein